MQAAEGEDSVDDFRQKGNHEFQKGNLDHAVTFYTLAIDKAKGEGAAPAPAVASTSASVVNLCNRSACYYQMEEFPNARDDALQAWNLSKQSNAKAAYRLAKTFMALGHFSSAKEILEFAITLPQLEPTELQSLKDLLQQAAKGKNATPQKPETTIKGVQRPISIREFIKEESLGVGNFSEIVIAKHRQTKEWFALKILEKKQAADLAKRQHPNVHNEITMEKRVLLERLPPHPHMIRMYHSFEDYNSLYYLMDLHNVNPDLWTQIRYQGKMVGCHPSQAKIWLWQLIDALEHFHSHGISHRDLKPENILLNERNKIVVIDFGTAKDLVKTDLNGPEFVGTPDFMSPEAVTGFSGMPKPGEPPKATEKAATHCADLWALGTVAFIIMTGSTPFWSPSPYLSFLRIKRGLLRRMPWGIPDDDAWDFVRRLCQVNPEERLGADCFKVEDGKVSVSKGYDILRQHKYFEGFTASNDNPIPSLKDLCIRACAELAKNDAIDLDICDQHPPGDDSSHDMMRLAPLERKSIFHVLDKLKMFSNGDETRVLQRFVRDDLEFLESKIRPESRDFVGLTQMNDDEGKPQSARGSADPYAKKDELEPTKLVHLTNPLLLSGEEGEMDEEMHKKFIKGWKKCIATINRARPKLVVTSGKVGAKCRKFLSRVSDSIPVVLNDGSAFYSFWLNGFQGLVLQSSTLSEGSPQVLWIREQLEQCRMAKHLLFCFVDCDPRDLEPIIVKRLARGRVLLLVGLSKDEPFETKISYEANETVVGDDVSVKSTDSVEDDIDNFTMKVVGTKDNGLRCISVDEKEGWNEVFESVEMPL
jgi:serine/threonine protein kinase